jgi:hypothetical protein
VTRDSSRGRLGLPTCTEVRGFESENAREKSGEKEPGKVAGNPGEGQKGREDIRSAGWLQSKTLTAWACSMENWCPARRHGGSVRRTGLDREAGPAWIVRPGHQV